MRNFVVLLILSSWLWAASTAVAHEPMQHTCSAPERPVDDQNDREWRAFLASVDAFRSCVNDKMEWHQAAARKHEQNAATVVGEWNDFVRTSLNVPEDFPWPESEEAE